MLRRGHLAESSKDRRRRSRDGALARYRLLKTCLASRQAIRREIIEACSSQAGLAKLSRPALGIFPMSLNTLKSASSDIRGGLGGWAEVDALRRQLSKSSNIALNRPLRIKRKPLDRLRERQTTLKHQLEQERRARATLVRAYTELLVLARLATKSSDELSVRLKRHLATFGEVGIHQLPTAVGDA
jgi:hypothetical protein